MVTGKLRLPTIETVNGWLENNRVKQITGNVALLLIGTIISQALLMLSLFMTARYLGVDAYGQYAATFVLLGQAAILLNFGLDTWLLREGAKSEKDITKKLSSALVGKLLLAGPWFLIVTQVTTQLNPEVYLESVVTIAALGFILQAIVTLSQAAFKSQLRNKITFLLQVSGNIILITLTFILIQQEPTIDEFAWARTLSLLGVAGIGLFFLIRIYGFAPQWQRLTFLVRQSTPFFLADALGYVYATVDITIVAVWLGKTAVGLYTPAITLINAAFIIPNTIHSVALPVIARAYHENQRSARVPALILIIVLTIEGLVATGITFILANPIIQLFYGDAFMASAVILSILSIILLFKSLSFALGTILTAINQQRDRVVVQAFVAAANVFLNLLVVGIYGVIGVAWVYVLTEFLLVIGYGWFAVKKTHRFKFASY